MTVQEQVDRLRAASKARIPVLLRRAGISPQVARTLREKPDQTVKIFEGLA